MVPPIRLIVEADGEVHPVVSPVGGRSTRMTGSAVVENSLELWNNQDREGYMACFAEDCEFNVPRRPGTGRAAVAAWWDFHATAFGPGHVRAVLLIESGETVVLEAVYEATHTGPLLAVGSRGEIP